MTAWIYYTEYKTYTKPEIKKKKKEKIKAIYIFFFDLFIVPKKLSSHTSTGVENMPSTLETTGLLSKW